MRSVVSFSGPPSGTPEQVIATAFRQNKINTAPQATNIIEATNDITSYEKAGGFYERGVRETYRRYLTPSELKKLDVPGNPEVDKAFGAIDAPQDSDTTIIDSVPDDVQFPTV